VIKSKQVSVYETTDGQEFTDEGKANAHQAILDATPDIEAFIQQTCKDSAPRHKKALARYLADFIRWQANKPAPIKPAEPKAEEPGKSGAKGGKQASGK